MNSPRDGILIQADLDLDDNQSKFRKNVDLSSLIAVLKLLLKCQIVQNKRYIIPRKLGEASNLEWYLYLIVNFSDLFFYL
jgi:hypothetical protein